MADRLSVGSKFILLTVATTAILAASAAFNHRGHVHLTEAASNVDTQGTARPATTVTPLSCTKLPHVPGKSVTTAIVDFPPNAYTSAHRHPGSVTAYVLKGVIRSQMEGAATVSYRAGSTWFEAPRALHMFAENVSADQPAQLLAVFVADDDCGPLVIPER
jgi:quercetin dioxygenase-like cupin family protein